MGVDPITGPLLAFFTTGAGGSLFGGAAAAGGSGFSASAATEGLIASSANLGLSSTAGATAGTAAAGGLTGAQIAGLTAAGLSAGEIALQARAQGQAQDARNQALEFQAQQADINAQIAEREGEALAIRHAAEQQEHRRRVSAALGQQKASVGGSGVSAGVGSPLAVSNAIVNLGYQDSLALRQQQGFRIFNIRNRAQQATQRGVLFRAQKGSARGSQFGTFLTGASKLSSQFARFKGY